MLKVLWCGGTARAGAPQGEGQAGRQAGTEGSASRPSCCCLLQLAGRPGHHQLAGGFPPATPPFLSLTPPTHAPRYLDKGADTVEGSKPYAKLLKALARVGIRL